MKTSKIIEKVSNSPLAHASATIYQFDNTIKVTFFISAKQTTINYKTLEQDIILVDSLSYYITDKTERDCKYVNYYDKRTIKG